MRRYSGIGILFLLIFFSSSVLASSTVTVTPLKNQVTVLEEATFDVKITNDESFSQTYTLYGLEIAWSVDPADRRFTLLPGQAKTTIVTVRPLGPFQPSTYSLNLYVDVAPSQDSIPTDRYTRELLVIIYPEHPADYLPTLRVASDIPDGVDPSQPLPIILVIENRNPLDLKGLKIRIQSDIPEMVQEAVIDLPPLEKKQVEFSIQLNKFQQPKVYTIFFVFEHAGETVKVQEQKIEIKALTPPFSVAKDEKTIFLKHFITLTVRNEGNVLNTQDAKVPISFLASLFSSGTGDIVSSNGERFMVWKISLHANEAETINYVTNYRIPLYILLVGVLFLLFYLAVRSPITLQKTANIVKGDEGMLSELKITLNVRNLTARALKDVTIIDTVPGIANVEKSLELGTIKPQEIKPGKLGSTVIWNLAELDAHEHRIITYKIKAKLNILGTLSLSRAVVEYGKGQSKRRKAYSNIFSINS